MEPQAPEPQIPMPEMEPRDPGPEREPQMESQDPASEPQPPMGTGLEIVRFGGPIYTRRGQKRSNAETVSESDEYHHRAPSPLRPRTDPIHRAPSPHPSPLRPDPGSSSSQAIDEYIYIERCRIQEQKTALRFLEDLVKELKRDGLSWFMKEEPTYRRNAESIFNLLERLRFEVGDLKKKMEDIFSLYSRYTKIISISCEQLFMEANKDHLTAMRELLEREMNRREVIQKSQDVDKHTFTTLTNSLHFEKLKAKKLEEEVSKIAQQINLLKSQINILEDAIAAAGRELNAEETNEFRSLRDKMFRKTKADTNVKLDCLLASIPS